MLTVSTCMLVLGGDNYPWRPGSDCPHECSPEATCMNEDSARGGDFAEQLLFLKSNFAFLEHGVWLAQNHKRMWVWLVEEWG